MQGPANHQPAITCFAMRLFGRPRFSADTRGLSGLYAPTLQYQKSASEPAALHSTLARASKGAVPYELLSLLIMARSGPKEASRLSEEKKSRGAGHSRNFEPGFC